MKNKFFLLILVILILFLISLVKAQNLPINLNLNKQEFWPYELIQIEVIGNLSKPLSENEIWIKKNDLIMPVKFWVEKISPNFYFAYAILNLAEGTYKLQVRVWLETIVKLIEKEIRIKKSLNQDFLNLYLNLKNKFPYLETKELIYGIKAIEGIDEDFDSKLINELSRKIGNEELSLKLLALLTLNSRDPLWQLQKTKLLNEILLFQVNGIGEFEINLTNQSSFNCTPGKPNFTNSLSYSFVCFKLNGTNLTNASQADLALIEANLVKTFKGRKKIYEFNKSLKQINGLKAIWFSIEKKFGAIEINKRIDENLTALALTVFKKYANLTQDTYRAFIYAFDWLNSKPNPNQLSLLALAISNLARAKQDLLTYQNFDGSFNSFWKFSEAEFTCLAHLANLPTQSLIEEWAKTNLVNLNLNERANCLAFALKPNPTIEVLPGLIKTQTGKSFDLYFTNKGIKNTQINLSNPLLNLNYSFRLEKEKTKKVTIRVPSLTAATPWVQDFIDLSFNEINYRIPLFIFIVQLNKTINLSLNETETEVIEINQTQKTINETLPLLNVFKLSKESIELNLTQPVGLELILSNPTNFKLKNIFISHSASLYGLLSIDPSYLPSLDPGQNFSISLNFKIPETYFETYEGEILVEAMVQGKTYEKSIPVRINLEKPSLKGCKDLNGSICKANEICEGKLVSSLEGVCCIGKCKAKKEKSKKILGIVFILIAILILVFTFFYLKRKPKKRKIEEILKRIQEKQIKREKGTI